MSSDIYITVDLPDDPDSWFERLSRVNPGKGAEEIVTDTVDRYLTLIGRSLPDLTLQQWGCIADTLGEDWEADEARILRLAADFSVAVDERELDREWGVDGQHLKDILSELTFAERMAVGEVTEMFWKSDSDEDSIQVMSAILSAVSSFAHRYRTTYRLSPDRIYR